MTMIAVSTKRKRAVVVAALLLAVVSPAHGQDATTTACATIRGISPDGGYAHCALGIVPSWNGLLLARGVEGERIANLNFFFPRSISAFVVGDSARVSAKRAFVTRRRAAALTDGGGLLLLTGALGAARSGAFTGAPRAMTLVGAAMFALSVPLHFAADGWLSRAVWWHNANYSR